MVVWFGVLLILVRLGEMNMLGNRKKKFLDLGFFGVLIFFIGSFFDMRFDLLFLRGFLNGVKLGVLGFLLYFVV